MTKQIQPTLPSRHYFDPVRFQRELEAIWYRQWLCVGRTGEWSGRGHFRRFEVGDQEILVVRDGAGELRAFHNTCRHRGAQLCQEESGRFRAGRMVCPYHAWAYALTGELVSVPRGAREGDLDPAGLALYPVGLETWRGFVFVNLDVTAGPQLDTVPGEEAASLERWPLEILGLAHREFHDLDCNWKIFWENFLECYHCPGVHPELCRLVPMYGEGVAAREDLPDPSPLRTAPSNLRPGAVTWSQDGQTPLPWFEGLTAEDQARGMAFATFLPTMFVVGHVDYVRTVRLWPLTPTRTRLIVDWLLPGEVLGGADIDIERLVAFSRQVVLEDARVCEINQRGLHSRAHRQGLLLPQEYEVRAFHEWVLERLP